MEKACWHKSNKKDLIHSSPLRLHPQSFPNGNKLFLAFVNPRTVVPDLIGDPSNKPLAKNKGLPRLILRLLVPISSRLTCTYKQTWYTGKVALWIPVFTGATVVDSFLQDDTSVCYLIISSYRSFQSGFIFSISSSFQRLFHFFICFSLLIAPSMLPHCS